MAELRQNTWETDSWYAQYVAGNVEYAGAQGLYTWGGSTYGDSGRNTSGPSVYVSSPAQVGAGENWYNISGYGDGFTYCASKTNGTLWAWGWNDDGQLMQNDRTNRSSPVQVPGTDWAISGAGGNANVWGIKTDGSLWGAGNNGYGALGQNNTTKYSSPMQVPGTWSTAKNKFGGNHRAAAAIKADGTLWAWGENESGWLGQNNTTNYSSPRQIGTDTDWDTISKPPRYLQAAIKTSGELWVWGSGNKGQFGTNQSGDNYRRSSPVQVPGTTWKLVCGGVDSVNATKTDGTLWSWGSNTWGALGHNNEGSLSSPTQLPGTDWDIPLNFDRVTGGIKTNGTLWLSGRNDIGRLGQNTTTTYSSPVQIPGSWVDMGGSGELTSLAAINLL